MFRIAISRLDDARIVPEHRETVLSVDDAVRAVLTRLPAADPALFSGRTVQDSVNRFNDFRRDVVAGGRGYRVVIAPMM
ncbi:hypothetical protein SUDANB121_03995 [Nocardiopsis dassonvillei]|uniref:hypothetical protein n=1 Tax=Nocardiopsis dassonvillei TaxID=2014 RepID=UPI003F56CD23